MELTTLQVSTTDAIGDLLDLVHDETFDSTTFSFDDVKHSVTIPVRRCFHNGPRRLVKSGILYRVYELDVIESLLTIDLVDNCQVNDPSRIEVYTINTITYQYPRLTIRSNEDLEIDLMVSGLSMECRDLRIHGKAHISYFLFCEFGPKFIS